MLPLLTLLGVPLAPPADDLDHFPPWVVTVEQREACRDHLDRLRVLRGARGWEGGRWDDALDETRARLAYWDALWEAHLDKGEDGRRACLARLRELIGPARYLRRWAPAAIPEMPPRWSRPQAPERIEPCGANGR